MGKIITTDSEFSNTTRKSLNHKILPDVSRRTIDAARLSRFASDNLSTPECKDDAKCLLRLLEFENDF